MQILRRSLTLFVLLFFACSLADAQTPLRLVNVTPCRLVDTRSGIGPFQGTQMFDLRQSAQNGGAYGTCPPFSLSSAQAYSLNVTLVPVNQHRVGYLTIWPTGETQPFVSLMNSDGRIKANAGIVPAGTNGEVSVYVTDNTNVLIDIDAYFDGASDPNALAFYPLEPCRLVDTRQQNGGAGFQGTMTFNLPLSASGGGVDGTCSPINLSGAQAQAYSLNITALPVNGSLFYLTVWPDGQTQPVVSTLNDAAPYGTVVANAAIVPAGMQQLTNVYATDQTNLLIDINGYFAPANSAPGPLSLYNVTPCRILDTRNGIGVFQSTIPVGIVGSSCGIPSNQQAAFVLNATVVPPGPMGYLTLWPEGQSMMPVVSTLNAYDGAITSNMAIVPEGTFNDSIDAFAFNPTQLILDISSYFAPVTALSVETTSLPDGTLNTGYSAPLIAIGGVAPYTWVQAGGHLPPGVSISSSGTISGTPSSTGTYSFGVQVTDSNSPAGVVDGSLQITVNATGLTLAVTTTSLPNGSVNTPYNALLTANGGVTPYTWSIVSGSLPAGLNLIGSTGQITGVPGAAGLSEVTVQVTDALNHTAMQALSFVVDTGDASGTLNGMYAFSFTGYTASTQTPFVVAGSLTMDGEGHVTGGEYDFNRSDGVQYSTVTGGGYMLGSDGLGQLNFTDNSGGNTQMLIAVGSGEDSRVISMNTSGQSGYWGAGVFRQQNPSDFSHTALAGNWAFGLQGFDSNGHPLAADGAYQSDSSGNFNGVEDINDFGTDNQVMLTNGHPTSSIDSNGRVTSQVQLSGIGTSNLVHYTISANETVGIRIDSGGPVLVTNSLRQRGTFTNSSLNGKSIGRGSRQAHANNNPVSQAIVQLFSSDGQGNINSTEDDNTGGVISQGAQLSGTYSVASNSRTVITLVDGSVVVCYLIQTNEGYCINQAAGGAELLYFEPQAAGPFSNAYLSGEYLGGSLPQYVSSTDSSIETVFADGVQNWTRTFDQSGPGGVVQNQTGSGTYSIDSTGAIALTFGGSPIAYGYVVGPNKFEVISLDSNPRILIDVRSAAP